MVLPIPGPQVTAASISWLFSCSWQLCLKVGVIKLKTILLEAAEPGLQLLLSDSKHSWLVTAQSYSLMFISKRRSQNLHSDFWGRADSCLFCHWRAQVTEIILPGFKLLPSYVTLEKLLDILHFSIFSYETRTVTLFSPGYCGTEMNYRLEGSRGDSWCIGSAMHAIGNNYLGSFLQPFW